MKKHSLGSAAIWVVVLAAFPASFALSFQADSSAAAEKAATLQMISPYRNWGKANREPIIISLDQIDLGG